MTTENPQPEPQKRNFVAEFITASGFGLPPEKCRHLKKPSPENEPNPVDQFIRASGFGLAKREN